MAEELEQQHPGSVQFSGPEKQRTGFELNIGSHIFRDTNGVLKIQGREQIVLEVNPGDTQLVLTMDVYDGAGHKLAHLRRNTWGLNEGKRFALLTDPAPDTLFTGPAWLKLSDNETGDVVLEASVPQPGKIHIIQGKFYSHKGALVEITSHVCRVGIGVTLFSDVSEHRGGTASIG